MSNLIHGFASLGLNWNVVNFSIKVLHGLLFFHILAELAVALTLSPQRNINFFDMSILMHLLFFFRFIVLEFFISTREYSDESELLTNIGPEFSFTYEIFALLSQVLI